MKPKRLLRKERQFKMKLTPSPRSGFTLPEIMLVVAIIAFVASIAIPNFMKARTNAQKTCCIANMKQIVTAVQQWALENKQPEDAAVATSDILEYLKGSAMPTCPTAGTYVTSVVSAAPICTQSADGHTL
jgi:prepilin-type N-terminal cleavage/methylation domain-containing protein